MKCSIGKKVLSGGVTALFILYNLTYPVTSLYALPQESEIVSGEVNFERVNDTTLNVHASSGAIINYNSFNIAQNETVQFYMPDINSFALNRVMGDGGTSILGNLYANGNLILIDTHGIMFGSTANVQVGGLIASTIDMSNQNFLNGAYIFGSLDQIPAEFSQAANYGHIVTRDGGFAVLIGSSVVNEGTISASLGTVALASGDMVTVGVSGDGFVSVGIDKEVSHQVFDAEGNPISDQIKNTGTLEAQGGRVLLNADAADAVFHQALNLEGVVKANYAEMQDGVVVITTSGSSEVHAEIEAGSITFAAQSGKEARYDFNDSTLEIANHFINGENVTVNADNANITVGGNWNNQGVFNGGNSTVEFVDASQSSTISGDNVFYNFRSVVPDKYIYFEAGKTQNILGTWKLEGAYAQHIRLLSTDPEAVWYVNPSGAREISYTWVEDSYNLNPEKIIMIESTNRDASYNWDPTGTWTNGAATGIWSDAGNWSGLGGATPGAGDDVVFNGTSTANSSVDTGVAFLGTINSLSVTAAYVGIITMNRSLTINTTSTQSGGTFSGGGNTLTVTGAYTLSGGTFNAGTASTIDLNSSFTLSSGTFNSNSSDISVAGGFTISGGTFNENTGTLTFDGGAATINVVTTETFNHLTFAPTTLGATKTVSASDTLVVNGTLNLTEGNVRQGTIPVPGTIQAKGDINQASTFDGGTGRLDINGTGTQTFTGSATTTTGNLPDININKASGTLNLAGTIRTNAQGAGAWTYTAGTIAPGTSTVVWDGAMTVTGSHTLNNLTFNNAGARTISAGTTVTTTGTFTYTDGSIATGTIAAQGDITQASTTDGGSGALLINGSASQLFTGSATTAAGSLPDVTINKTGGTLTLSGTIRSSANGAGAWTYTAGTVDATTNDSTVVFAGANTITSTGMSFDNIEFNAAGTKTLGSNLDVNGNLTISAGTLTTSASNFSINVAGNWANSATFTTNSSTITFDGTSGTQTLASGGSSFFNLVHSGASTLQLVTSNLTVTGALTNSAGTFDANGRTNTVTGLATISGGEYQASTATQTFNGGLTISGGTFTGSTGTVDVNGVMTLSSGTLTAPTGTFFVSGNWDKSGGTFTPGTGTVTFDGGAGTQTLNNGGTSFNNISHTGAGTLQIITNNLTVGGTLANSAGIFDMNGLTNTVTGLATLSGGTYQGLTATQTFDGGLTVSGGTFTGSTGAVDVNGNVTLTSGTFTAPSGLFTVSGNWARTAATFTPGSNTVTFDGTGTQTLNSGGSAFNNILHSGSGTLQLLTNALTTSGTFTNSTGTFNANGLAHTVTGLATISGGIYQASTATQTFNGGLTISGGTFTGSTGVVDVNGVMTLSSGTLTAPTGTFSVSGNWDKSGGTFTPGTGTVTFDGAAGTQTLNSGGSSFNNISHTGAGTLQVVTNNLTVGGTLGNSAGIFDMNGLTNTVTGLATLSGGTYQGLTATQTFNGGLTVSGGTLTGSTGTVDVNGTFTLSAGTFTAPTGTFSVSGGWTHTAGGTFTHNSGTVTLDGGSATINVITTETFNNLTIDSTGTKTITAGDTLTAVGTLTLTDGTVNTGTLDAEGNAVVGAGFDGGTAPLTFTGTGAQSFDLTGAEALFNGNITINKASGTVTMLSNLTMDAAGQDLSVTLGELSLGTRSLTVADQLTINGGTLTQGSGTITSSNDFVISSGTLTRGTGLITVADDMTVSGSGIVTASAGDITLSGGAGSTFTISGATASVSLGTGSLTAGDINQSDGTFNGGTGIITLSDDFTVSGGTFTSTSGTMSIADNFTHSAGTFNHNSGTVTLNGTDGNQTITGSTTFNNLTRTTTTAQTLTFVAGTTQTILGTMTLQGATGALLSLRSSAAGTQWNIDPQGTRTVSFLDVQDSNNINATAISCTNGCVDSGNNINWILAPPVPPIVPSIGSNESGLINNAMDPLWDENWPWNVEFPVRSKTQPITEESFYTRPDVYYEIRSMRQRREADAAIGFGVPKPGKKQEGVIICESLIFGGVACA